MFETAQLFIETFKTSYANARNNKLEREYAAMIAESQIKLAETTLVPGYTKIYA